VIPGESAEAFNDFREAIFRQEAPVGPVETALVELMAMAQWKLRRVWAMEAGVYRAFDGKTPQANEDPCVWLAQCMAADLAGQRVLDRMSLHETRLSNQLLRCGKRLDVLRDQRRKGLLPEGLAGEVPSPARFPASQGSRPRATTDLGVGSLGEVAAAARHPLAESSREAPGLHIPAAGRGAKPVEQPPTGSAASTSGGNAHRGVEPWATAALPMAANVKPVSRAP
jgi:hypothetical protein